MEFQKLGYFCCDCGAILKKQKLRNGIFSHQLIIIGHLIYYQSKII